ncbi:AAC_HP2_G0007660.mRNA.1.CDS.1 [Saccharomyces cerevisiae]|nr:Snu23p [Saccharomyces cerevisiae FostersB]CAI5244181.1 AAC_HP2_G0007660.mRNA.1.CDS.1 [Saccharomyces cerevisiae]CAI6421530.1 AAC_HP2_G0007660.mRNA.1.CDS.1 [Saccharomyces cerevisiae]CAI6425457.1 AAC_HP1_G0008750.mRNA.1.CDS.1 [Saccharomyces cerevisiae]CAI6540249.1 AAC_collapsed_G0007980.mRNA.1.CDS.1 [Saccharomyces cerevisiae]
MSNFGRRTWDREEYAEQARSGYDDRSLKATLTPIELQALKSKYTNYDHLIKGSLKDLNKRKLTANTESLSSFKRGKKFGFYCDICNLTFKDTLQYIDHLNHKVHAIKFENLFDEPLIIDIRDNDDVPQEEFELCYHNLIKDFVEVRSMETQSKRKRLLDTDVEKAKKVATKPSIESESKVSKMMGFSNFATSKK